MNKFIIFLFLICLSCSKESLSEESFLEKIQNTFILQPSIIEGKRNEQRIGEKIGLAVFKLVQPLFFGKLKKYKITKAEHIAQTMVNLANSPSNKELIASHDIEALAINTNI